MAIRSRNKVNVNFNMSSMTDMVFLLLIFVLIIAQFKHNSALNILIPNTPESNTTEYKESISVGIEQDLITGKLTYMVNRDENKVAFDNLGPEIRAALEGIPQPNVMIYVDQQVPTQNTMEVIALINDLGYTASIKTDPPN